MKRKYKTVFWAASIILLLCAHCFAETIYFKDGRVVNEVIINRTEFNVTTRTEDGRPHRYHMEEIDYIKEETADDLQGEDASNIDFTQYEFISAEKAQLISTFINASGVRKNMTHNIDQVIDRVPEEKREELRELFSIDDLIGRMIPVYDKYYTEDDLNLIIQFYQSPTGQKVLEVTPEIMKESVGVSVDYLKDKAAPQNLTER